MNIKNFTTSELEAYYKAGRVMFHAFKTVWQLHYSTNAGYSFIKVISIPASSKDKYTVRGRFMVMRSILAIN